MKIGSRYAFATIAVAILVGQAHGQYPPADGSLLAIPHTNTQALGKADCSTHCSDTRSASLDRGYRGLWAGYSYQEEIQGEAATHVEGDYARAMESGWGGDCASCTSAGCATWFGGIYGLYMNRDRANEVSLSIDDLGTGGLGNIVLDSRDASMDWSGGAEVRLGRTFGGGDFGFEAVYWGIYPDDEEANAYGADYFGDLNTVLALDDLDIGADNVADWYNNAARHRLRRTFEMHNVELNLLRFSYGQGSGYGVFNGQCGSGYGHGGCGHCGSCGACRPFHLSGLLGVRYLKIDDGFMYSSDETNTVFGDAADEEVHYNVDTENFLIGVQLGCRGDYYVAKCFTLFADLKYGLYGNHIRNSTRVFDGNGNNATINNGTWAGEEYNFSNSKNDVAFIGEILMGMNYQITCNWRASLAYRAVAVTGVAMSTNQVPADFSDAVGVQDIDSNGSMILHGLQAGLEFNF